MKFLDITLIADVRKSINLTSKQSMLTSNIGNVLHLSGHEYHGR